MKRPGCASKRCCHSRWAASTTRGAAPKEPWLTLRKSQSNAHSWRTALPSIGIALLGGETCALGDQLPSQWQQGTPVFDRVLQWIEAADEECGEAEVVIVAQRLGHLVR